MFDGHPHPAASLTAEERAEAIVYLEWLDAFWDEHGEDGWLQNKETSERPTRVEHCLITAPGTWDATQSAMNALGFPDDWKKIGASAPVWNDAASTTFTMVHTRVKTALAACRALEGAS